MSLLYARERTSRDFLTCSLDPSLDRDPCENDSGADPLTSSELVVIYDDGEEHREELPRQCDRTGKK